MNPTIEILQQAIVLLELLFVNLPWGMRTRAPHNDDQILQQSPIVVQHPTNSRPFK